MHSQSTLCFALLLLMCVSFCVYILHLSLMSFAQSNTLLVQSLHWELRFCGSSSSSDSFCFCVSFLTSSQSTISPRIVSCGVNFGFLFFFSSWELGICLFVCLGSLVDLQIQVAMATGKLMGATVLMGVLVVMAMVASTQATCDTSDFFACLPAAKFSFLNPSDECCEHVGALGHGIGQLAGAKCLCYLAKKFSHDCDIANSLSIPQKCSLSVPSGFSCAGTY